jgi:hypothetical protein
MKEHSSVGFTCQSIAWIAAIAALAAVLLAVFVIALQKDQNIFYCAAILGLMGFAAALTHNMSAQD